MKSLFFETNSQLLVIFRRQLLVPRGIQCHLFPFFSHEHSVELNGILNLTPLKFDRKTSLLYFLCITCTLQESPRQFSANGKCHTLGIHCAQQNGTLTGADRLFSGRLFLIVHKSDNGYMREAKEI